MAGPCGKIQGGGGGMTRHALPGPHTDRLRAGCNTQGASSGTPRAPTSLDSIPDKVWHRSGNAGEARHPTAPNQENRLFKSHSDLPYSRLRFCFKDYKLWSFLCRVLRILGSNCSVTVNDRTRYFMPQGPVLSGVEPRKEPGHK